MKSQDSFWRIIQFNYSQHEIFALVMWAAELERLETRRRVAR